MSFQNAYTPSGAAAVTPSDSTMVDFYGLFVGGAGNLTVTGGDGVDAVFTGVVAGQILSMRITKVKSTGTTATNITGFKA